MFYPMILRQTKILWYVTLNWLWVCYLHKVSYRSVIINWVRTTRQCHLTSESSLLTSDDYVTVRSYMYEVCRGVPYILAYKSVFWDQEIGIKLGFRLIGATCAKKKITAEIRVHTVLGRHFEFGLRSRYRSRFWCTIDMYVF